MIRTQMQKVLLYPLLAGGFLILFGVSYLSSHEIIMSLFRGAVYLVLSLVVLLTAPFSRLKGGFRKAEVSVGKTLFYVRIPGKDLHSFRSRKAPTLSNVRNLDQNESTGAQLGRYSFGNRVYQLKGCGVNSGRASPRVGFLRRWLFLNTLE